MQSTLDAGLHIKVCSSSLFTGLPLSLFGFSNADWAASSNDRKLVGGYCVYLGDSLIFWSSRKQQVVARSSIEFEYRALSNLSAENVWIRFLLIEIQFSSYVTLLLWCDNLSASSLACNPVFHTRTKHIELNERFICDKIQAKQVEVIYVPSVDQTAYILTKSLAHTRFATLRDKFGILLSPPLRLRGNAKIQSVNQ